MQRFTTGDVLKLTELPGTSFDRWVNKGQVQPISGGSGTGNHRVWTLMQTVGWVVAAEAVEQSAELRTRIRLCRRQCVRCGNGRMAAKTAKRERPTPCHDPLRQTAAPNGPVTLRGIGRTLPLHTTRY